MSENEKREPLDIKIDHPEKFKTTGEFKLITSAELGSFVSKIFKATFADYEGCTFNVDPKNPYNVEPTFSLIFNHGDYSSSDDSDDIRLGIVSSINKKGNIGTSPIEISRHYDNMYNNGIRYLASDDLKDVVKKLLIPSSYNKGNPNWGKIVYDYCERNPYNVYDYNRMSQFTKVDGISSGRISSRIFGYKDDDGDIFDYEVRVIKPASQSLSGVVTNWIIRISRASTNEVEKLLNRYGYNSTDSSIIR